MIQFALLTSVSASLLILSAALYFDLRYQRIPNKLCLIALLSGIMINTYFSSWDGLITAFAGAGLALLILLPTYYFKLLGAGDVKIMVGVGAISGSVVIAWSIAYAIIFGALTSLLLAANKVGWTGVKTTLSRYLDCLIVRQYFKPQTGEAAAVQVPYAPALMLGWLLANYLIHDIYDLMWTVESALSRL